MWRWRAEIIPFIPAFLCSAAVCGGICLLFLHNSIAEGWQQRTILADGAAYVIAPLAAMFAGAFAGTFFPAGMWDFGGIGGGGLGGFFGVLGAAMIASIRRSTSYS